MSSPILAKVTRPPLLGPTQAEWAALSPAEREQRIDALEEQYDALEEAREPLACGDPHHEAIEEIRSALRSYYRRGGRQVYVGTDVLVCYPGEPVIRPDVIVVLDAEQKKRDRWVVVEEGKGVDLAIEVHNKGDFSKDFKENVETYAALGIPEYFAYAIERRRLSGFRLPSPEARVYRRIMPQVGRYASQVLGLDLVLEEGRVRFYAGNALLFPDNEMLIRLESTVDEAQARAEQEQVRAEQEQVRAEQEQVRAEQEQARARLAVQQLGQSLLMIMRLRNLSLDEAQQLRVLGCADVGLLTRWLERAATAASARRSSAHRVIARGTNISTRGPLRSGEGHHPYIKEGCSARRPGHARWQAVVRWRNKARGVSARSVIG